MLHLVICIIALLTELANAPQLAQRGERSSPLLFQYNLSKIPISDLSGALYRILPPTGFSPQDRSSLPIEQRVDMDLKFYLASGATIMYIAARAIRDFALQRGPQLP
jgi:hypothetical protein